MTTVREEAQADPDAGAELAVRTWQRLRPGAGSPRGAIPTDVVRLKRQRRAWNKTAVYRLDGVGPGGSAVIAKRCLWQTAHVERQVYEAILPRLPLPRLRYYGSCVDEEREDFCWLFLGDAGNRKPTMADRATVGQWLARVHGGAAKLGGDVSLPARGPDHYLRLLSRARAGLDAARAVAGRSGLDCDTFGVLAETMGRLEARWGGVSAACRACPHTLVHADFTRKNVRLCPADDGAYVIALDWETAGWGSPAPDLADVPWGRSKKGSQPDGTEKPESETPWYGPVALDAYAATIAEFWPSVQRSDLERLSVVGSVFRVIDATCWASHQVEFGGLDKGMARLGAYADDLVQAVALLEK